MKFNEILATGVLASISQEAEIKVEGKKPKKRAILEIDFEDGQKAFFEIRDAVIKRMETLGVQEGDTITFGYVLAGVNKSGKKYNNLYINSLNYVNQN